MRKILRRGLQAIIPIYDSDGGNYTIIRLSDADILMKKSVSSVVKEVCRVRYHNLKESNKECRALLGIRKIPPIPLAKDLILIGVKTRKPIGRDDGAHSYVNTSRIDYIEDRVIFFKGGNSLKTLNKACTVKGYLDGVYKLERIMNERGIIIGENIIREEYKLIENTIELPDGVKISYTNPNYKRY